MKYEQFFRVRGSGQFPYDMLRYDHCFPCEEDQSSLLSRDDAGELREVDLMRYVATRDDFPTIGRWQSFCWDVIAATIRTERI